MKNAINWFEIPTRNLDKAVTFYETVLGTKLLRETFGGVPHGVFPSGAGTEEDPHGVGGALVDRAEMAPGAGGSLVYLDVPSVAGALDRARAAGGKVLQPETEIAPHGWIGTIADLDGNVVGLHAMPKAG